MFTIKKKITKLFTALLRRKRKEKANQVHESKSVGIKIRILSVMYCPSTGLQYTVKKKP